MKTLLTAGLILLATQAHAQSNPAEPSRCEIESNECHPPALPIDPCYKPSGGYICAIPKPACKPGQVVFEGRCLTPDRRQPAKRWCGEDLAAPIVRDLLRVFCR